MNKLVFSFLFILGYGATFAQPLKVINNTITPSHEHIEGTKLYAIPPKGFSQAKPPIIGFVEDGGENSIIFNESAGSYKALIQTFMTENMTVKGLKLITQEKVTLNDSEATLLKLQQKKHKSTFMKYLFFFGDDEYAILVSAIFPSDDRQMEENIKQSLLSVAYKEEVEALPQPKGFKLDFEALGLTFARSIADAVIYTENGKNIPASIQKNSFFAGNGINKNTDIVAFSEERVKKQVKNEVKIEKSTVINIGDKKATEILATTMTADAKTRWLYQVLVFDGEKYYIMNGSTTDKNNLAKYETIVKSFILE